jgi:ATP-dependent DNA ligase
MAFKFPNIAWEDSETKKIWFPRLYKKSSLGNMMFWEVYVLINVIHIEYGQVGGKTQKTQTLVRHGHKETNPKERCIKKAESLYTHKIKEGYKLSPNDAQLDDDELLKPMLAHVIQEHLSSVTFPCAVEPKLDGKRNIAVIENGKCRMYSRTGKPTDCLPHIEKDLLRIFGQDYIVLDGELYNHELKHDFEKIISMSNRKEVHPDAEKQIHYFVYDVIDPDKFYLERVAYAKMAIEGALKPSSIFFLNYEIVNNYKDLMEKFRQYVHVLGYEGAMYRDLNSPYIHHRTDKLLKIKEFKDAEYLIVGVYEGIGKKAGMAGSLICENEKGLSFRVPCKKLPDESSKDFTKRLKDYLNNFDSIKGKMLTVQFQNLTENGIPRFPVGVRIRGGE